MTDPAGSFRWLIGLAADERFLLPFYTTISAAITLLLLQHVARLVADRRKKLYAVAYILDACFRLQKSAFILLKHTILPHIEATKRVLDGDSDLLETMFLADEFDILKAGPVAYDHLSEDTKALLGYDDIELVQLFDSINYLCLVDTNRQELNVFVKEHLKSGHDFLALTREKQEDVLSTYWDYLDSIKHEETRIIASISAILVPRFRLYLKERQFFLFSTKSAKAALARIEADLEEYADLVPGPDFFARTKSGGIQRALS